jgi:hypothetical protein
MNGGARLPILGVSRGETAGGLSFPSDVLAMINVLLLRSLSLVACNHERRQLQRDPGPDFAWRSRIFNVADGPKLLEFSMGSDMVVLSGNERSF